MTATPNFASEALTGAGAGDAAPAPNAGPFVLNLCSSTTPMALAQTDLPELKRFTFFVSRRFEEGRERFRLHMGYFATLAEDEEWLNVVREIYPGAWAGEAPGRKLRERAAAAAAAQVQHAAGPQPQVSAPRAAAPPVGRAMPAPPPARTATGVAPPRSSAPPRPAAPAAAAAARPSAAARAGAAPAMTASPQHAEKSVKGAKGAFGDSNVREVLKALGDASATGQTRQMRAPPAPREAPPTPAKNSLSDTQVLKLLETRRPEGSEPPASDPAHGAIPLLKPDDTGTREALKYAVTTNAPVLFAVQLQWSVQAVELDKVPPLAIFSAYTLYTVEGSRDGRKWYGLRLGFFSDAISAKQVAHYVRSEFTSVAVVPVSPQEKSRATEQDKQAATLGAPAASPSGPVDEFKLLDDDSAAEEVARLARAPVPAPKPAAGAAPKKIPGRPVPRVAVGRAVIQAGAPGVAPPAAAKPNVRGA